MTLCWTGGDVVKPLVTTDTYNLCNLPCLRSKRQHRSNFALTQEVVPFEGFHVADEENKDIHSPAKARRSRGRDNLYCSLTPEYRFPGSLADRKLDFEPLLNANRASSVPECGP